MATIRDVAREARVSVATVSRVLNGTSAVGPEMTERVRQAVISLAYEPSSVARSLKTASTMMIACVIPDISNPFFPEMVRGVEDAAAQFGYATLLGNTDNDGAKEVQYLRLLARRRVDALILTPAADEAPPAPLRHLIERNVPVVVVDRRLDGLNVDTVLVNNRRGGELAAEHLLALGHRRIAIINRTLDTSTARERQEGFVGALKRAGAYRPELVRFGSYSGQSGRVLAHDLLSQPERPTAILAASDVVAMGALRAASDLGLDVPADLSIIGFDGIAAAELVNPPLTTIAQPIYQLGQLSASIAMERRQGSRTAPPGEHILEPTVQLGASTGPAR